MKDGFIQLMLHINDWGAGCETFMASFFAFPSLCARVMCVFMCRANNYENAGNQ